MGGRKPRSAVLVFEGRRYTWSIKNGAWRCTTAADRHNLARRIYERAHGPVPAGHIVIYLDGNRFNLAPENLAAMTHRDVQLRRLQDPDYRAILMATGFYGQLSRAIQDSLDPSRRRTALKKAWETSRRRYGPSGRSKKRSVA